MILACALGMLGHYELSAQELDPHAIGTKTGKLSIRQTAEVDAAIDRFKKYNYSSAGVDGFRIQIFSESGNDAKGKAEKVLADYRSQYELPVAYLTYQQPNFKVRCGDFRTKSEARKYIKLISPSYPSAFIVKDAIHIKE